MTNAGKLDQNLQELAALENILWKAFIAAEKKYAPPFYNLAKSIPSTNRLLKQHTLKNWEWAPYYWLAAIISAILTITWSPWIIFIYGTMITLTKLTKEKYINAYTIDKLKTTQYAKHGFGIENLSLTVAGVMHLKETGEGKLTPGKITSIVKLMKASTEFEDISYGIADHIKKSLFAAPLAFIVWFQNNPDFTTDFQTFIENLQTGSFTFKFVVYSFFIYGLIVLSVLGYGLILGQTITKRQKRNIY